MSPARTKDDLHVHVNTVAQRLQRVGRLLGADWQDPARALEVQLALRLRRLADPGRTRHAEEALRPRSATRASSDETRAALPQTTKPIE